MWVAMRRALWRLGARGVCNIPGSTAPQFRCATKRQPCAIQRVLPVSWTALLFAHERIVFQAHSPRDGLFKREPNVVGTNACRDGYKRLRTLLRYLANGL
jgi:hypothetical protein